LQVDNGKLLHLDAAALAAKANHWKEKIKNLQPGIG
jgi:hypothetical protein